MRYASPLSALARGKIPRANRSEDAITGAVLGTLRWLPEGCDLVAFLAQARPHLDVAAVRQVEFWPWWDRAERADGAEPDAVVWVSTVGGEEAFLVVEAKHLSGKSGHGERDQLYRQYANALALRAEHSPAPRFLGVVYLTSHLAPPHQDLNESRNHIARRLDEVSEPQLFWLSWRAVIPLLETVDPERLGPLQAALLHDLVQVLERAGLDGFKHWPATPIPPNWRFRASWPFTPAPVPTWSFSETT